MSTTRQHTTQAAASERLPARATWLWGIALALWLSRGLLLAPPGMIHDNHESNSYVVRQLEFRDCLEAGYLFPQWCTHFRGGLGSPYFAYYQPGCFYAASLVPDWIGPVQAMGWVVFAFALLGYMATDRLVAARAGGACGAMAGSVLLLSVYPATEIYVRGDLSELAAMMVLPGAALGLDRWLNRGAARDAVLLAVAGGGLIVLHPAVALVGYAALTSLIAAYALVTRRWYDTAMGLAALATGVGLAAFYWIPLAAEWHFVDAQHAFDGHYHFSRHFVSPLQLLWPIYDRQTAIPFTLGPVVPGLVVANCLGYLFLRRRKRDWQTGLFIAAVLVTIAGMWFMSPASAGVWQHIKLLEKIQFPWRLLTLVSVASAIACGLLPPVFSPRTRGQIAFVVVAAMCLASVRYTHVDKRVPLNVPDDAASLAQVFYAPDLRNEWLPRGADAGLNAPTSELITGPSCEAWGFKRTQGHLRCELRTTDETFVVLPHYFFRAGWQATLDGRPIAHSRDPQGRLRVDLSDGAAGVLDVRFSMTPMKRVGVATSAWSLIACLPALCIVTIRRRAAKGGRATPVATTGQLVS